MCPRVRTVGRGALRCPAGGWLTELVKLRGRGPMVRATSPVMPVWRPVRGGNAFEITVARLVQAIKLGLVTEGDRLPPERVLAEELRVSRVTLREAIRALREAGYLESRRGRSGGTFVLAGTR